MSSPVTDAAGQLRKNAELWQKFMKHEAQVTNITDLPEVDDMSSAKAQKAADTLTDEDQNETVGHLRLRRSSCG